MDVTQNLSKNLITIRAAQQLSLVNFSNILGISKSTLQEIERGHTPRLDTVECIAQNLGVPVPVLLSDMFGSNQNTSMADLIQPPLVLSNWTQEDRSVLLCLIHQIAVLFNKYAN